MKKWYNWPENYYDKPWLPWHSIARRCIALPFAVLAFVPFYVFVALGWGVDDAEQIRKETF